MRARRRLPLVLGDAAQSPQARALDRALLILASVEQRGALVEREHDVGTDLVLHLHRDFGSEPVHRAIQVRTKRHPVVIHVCEAVLARSDDIVGLHAAGIHGQHLLEAHAQREHLEATAVRDGRAVPAHEGGEPARVVDNVGTGLQVQVIGVCEDHLCAEVTHGLRHHRLDRGFGAHGCEGGRLDIAVW